MKPEQITAFFSPDSNACEEDYLIMCEILEEQISVVPSNPMLCLPWGFLCVIWCEISKRYFNPQKMGGNKMTRQCAWCHLYLGQVEPVGNMAITHSICPTCAEELLLSVKVSLFSSCAENVREQNHVIHDTMLREPLSLGMKNWPGIRWIQHLVCWYGNEVIRICQK